MYIPSLLFGALNTCVDASGHDETGIFLSGSQVWEYYKFTGLGSGSFTINSGSSNDVKVFMVAGGGAGGFTEFNGEALNEVAGGGGAGGVTMFDARIGPGTYNLYIGSGSDTSGSSGEDTWIELGYSPTNYTDSYITSASRITAEGGGFGAYLIDDTIDPGVEASSGGSGGGGCASLRTVSIYATALAGSGRPGQGFGGGDIDGLGCASSDESVATGGGGADSSSQDTNCIGSAGYQTPGADGLFFNVDGTLTEYACGGASMRQGTWENATNDTQPPTSRMYGAGGWGASTSYGQSKFAGRPGILVIMVPVCNPELTSCNEYAVHGGASGGNFTFIPCGNNDIETLTLDPLDNISICSYPLSPYPSGSGDVTFTATGSCSRYVEPIDPPSCASGSSLEPLYNTQLVITAPSVGPYPGFITFDYIDYLGTTQGTGNLGTGTHNICAQSGSVQLTTQTAGSSYVETFTSVQCGYYCSASAPYTCEEWRFTAGSGGGTATYTPCGGSQTVVSFSADQVEDYCITSGSFKSITGIGSSLTFLTGSCT
jgi:hypothetical protein